MEPKSEPPFAGLCAWLRSVLAAPGFIWLSLEAHGTLSSRVHCRREMRVAQGAPQPQQKQFQGDKGSTQTVERSRYEFGQRGVRKEGDITVFRLETAAREGAK